MLLRLPDVQQPFSSLCAVEQLFSLSFFVISNPLFIEGVCLCDNFLESDNLRIGRIDHGEVGCTYVFASRIQYRCKRPHSVFDVMPVFRGNPSVTFVLMSALCPLPQAFVDLIIYEAEHFGGYDVAMIVHPSTNHRIQSANELVLCCGFARLDDFAHLG